MKHNRSVALLGGMNANRVSWKLYKKKAVLFKKEPLDECILV